MCDYTSEEIQGMILSVNKSIIKITEVLQKHNEELRVLNTAVQNIIDYLNGNSHY